MLKFFTAMIVVFLAGAVFGQNQIDNAAAAKSFIDTLAKKDFAAAQEFFSESFKAKVPAASLPPIWDSVTAQLGAFKSQGKVVRTPKAEGEKISTVCEFEKSSIAVSTVFDKSGKISGFFFEDVNSLDAAAAPYETPKYADAKLFTEKDVTVGAGEWALPGTLTMPVGKTKNVPAIVLVHGSGPNDRDETHINRANKIFKDLAWGLASKGIAVLRYDKRTLVYGQKIASMKNGFTLDDETINDALAAVELLRKTVGVDAKKIFVLGHSLGGLAIPRIGRRDAQIAGLIVFAGTARPLEDVIVEQYNYLGTVGGAAVSKDEQEKLDQLAKLADATKKLKPTDAAETKTLLNLPVAYWIDLNNYNPPAVAQKLKQPMLILQGESDYQVTMKDFQNWKNALGTRKNVRFKTYPNLTHTFMEGLGGKPNPQDYAKTNHVSETVVGDIAGWILETSK